MDIHEILMQLKNIYIKFLEYIDDDNNCNEENYQNLILVFKDQKIQENPQNLKLILHLISKVSNYHYRSQFFISKIEKIILFFKNQIKQFYSNYEIFTIFRFNKRILLFLINEELFQFDKFIVDVILSKKYSSSYVFYFFNEIRLFIDKNLQAFYQKEINEKCHGDMNNYEENRKIGENDSQLCQIIRNDSIDEFITYVNKENLSLSSTVERSYYETNIFLIKSIEPNQYEANGELALIEYASFFGSIQIFRYLFKNGIELKPSLFQYAIHGKDPELINILEENDIKPSDNGSYQKWIKESIKCHHNEIIDYIQNNYSQFHEENNDDFFIDCLHNYNFASMINNERNYEPFFFYFCENDFISIVEFLLCNSQININARVILLLIFLLMELLFIFHSVFFIKFFKKCSFNFVCFLMQFSIYFFFL